MADRMTPAEARALCDWQEAEMRELMDVADTTLAEDSCCGGNATARVCEKCGARVVLAWPAAIIEPSPAVAK